MKKLKLLLLSIITPLLCIGVSFGVSVWFSDSSYLLESISYWSLNSNNANFKYYDLNTPFCVSFYNGVSSNNYDSSFQVRGCAIDQNYWFEQCGIPLNVNIHFNVSTSSTIYCFDPTSWSSDYPWYNLSSILFDWSFWNYSLTSVDYNIYSIGAYTPTNCSSIQSQLSSCQSDLNTMSWSYNTCLNTLNDRNWQIWTLSWSLASCTSDLNSCLSNWSSCDTLYWVCVENLSWCNADKSSLQLYNESLSSQLNECLSAWTWSWIWSGAIFTFDFDVFRSDDWHDYSLPITNNLFLPNWYKAMLNSDHVLTIAKANSLNHAYSISDDEFSNKVISSYWTIFIFLMSLSFMLLFLFTIRKYFIWLKSVK